jgi:hypothetical protein
MCVLGLAAVFVAITNELWFGLGAAACWLILGIRCFLLWRKLKQDGDEHRRQPISGPGGDRRGVLCRKRPLG